MRFRPAVPDREINNPRLPAGAPASSRRLAAAAVVLLVTAACVWVALPPRRRDRINAGPRSIPLAPVPTSPYRNTAPDVAFIGDEACARCHSEIARTFRDHPMGRSTTVAAAAKPEANGVVFEADKLVYTVLHRNGHLIHREERRDADGRVDATHDEVVRFALGSGRRGTAYLVEREGTLYQSPISWYAQEQRFDLAPGYEKHNLHFARPITPECLYCHTNRVEMASGKSPVFHGLAIGCERCHGPGALHARLPDQVDGRDWTIVNPADLEPRSLRESVCEQCHLQGSSRSSRPGRTMSDYRPGLPFDAFVEVAYSHRDHRGKGRAVGHVEQMRKSRCYEESRRELGCISCHDPHRLPDPADRIAYYRGRCLECHSERGCVPPRDTRVARDSADCTACHMPRAAASDIAHTALTDHAIPRQLDNWHRPPGSAGRRQ